MKKQIMIISDNLDRFIELQRKLNNLQYEAEIIDSITFNVKNFLDIDIFVVDFSTEKSVIDYITKNSLKMIVVDKEYNYSNYKILSKLKIVDYITLDDDTAFKYCLRSINRFFNNKNYRILIVDDSPLVLISLEQHIRVVGIQTILKAKDGKDAIKVLYNEMENNRTIDLIFTDFDMPNMDGIELTKKVRESFAIDELPIIALSSHEGDNILSRFLKSGANDYIVKSSTRDEVICRLNLHLENLERNREIKELAKTDFLTGLPNRRSFFDRSQHIVNLAKRNKDVYSVAIIDVDLFKRINDIYGFPVGDLTLKLLGKLIQESLRASDIVARFSGEEFNILLPNTSLDKAFIVMDRLRNKVENIKVEYDRGRTLNFTISIGLAVGNDTDIERVFEIANRHLYRAKENGRNRVEPQFLDESN
jgi:diguanylate cyclase (GGDEF)-like protein